MSNKIIGSCSICKGQVVVPTIYHSVSPPVPQCSSCGAVEEKSLPTIKMRKLRTNESGGLRDGLKRILND